MVETPITWLFPLEILRRPQAWCLLLTPTLAHPRLVLFLVQSFFFFLVQSFVPGAETKKRVCGSNLQRVPALSQVADTET